MQPEVKKDMSLSAKAFDTLVWPEVSDLLGGGKIFQMENSDDIQLAKLLDISAGIDAWQVNEDGIRGIASRIQRTSIPYNTFTVRMSRDSGVKTEYEKRNIAIETGKFIYPHVSIQAYIQTWKGPILSVGIAKTEDIIKFINLGLHSIRRTTNASFAVCPWIDMRVNNFKVLDKTFKKAA